MFSYKYEYDTEHAVLQFTKSRNLFSKIFMYIHIESSIGYTDNQSQYSDIFNDRSEIKKYFTQYSFKIDVNPVAIE